MSAGGYSRKLHWVRPLQRYVINPPLRWAVRHSRYPGHILIETLGHRTGRLRTTIVGARHAGPRTLVVVAEHGRSAGWVRNLRANPTVRVLVEGRWHAAVAVVDDDRDPEEILQGWDDPAHVRAVRLFATDPAVVRIALTGADSD